MPMYLVKLIKATAGIKERANTGLHDLLYSKEYNQESWLVAAKQLLWDSDSVPEVVFAASHHCTRLKFLDNYNYFIQKRSVYNVLTENRMACQL